jgi:hypothetical protein
MLDEQTYVRNVLTLVGLTEPETGIIEWIKYYRQQGLGVQSAAHQVRIALQVPTTGDSRVK